MDRTEAFSKEVEGNIAGLRGDTKLKQLSADWMLASLPHRYSYNFTALGRPIIQYPQDIVAMQELIWEVKPDLIIETGIAHGGSLILSASVLSMLDYCEALESGEMLDPRAPKRMVVGVDIDIRAHNRSAIEQHPMARRIRMVQGSSIDKDVIAHVHKFASPFSRVMVCLDSNHTHEHVLAELHAYAPLVSPGSYCVVFDTIIEDLPARFFSDRSWGPGDNPKTALHAYVDSHPEFEIDTRLNDKLLLTVAPDGYLRRKS